MLHIKNLHKSYGAFEVLRGLEMNVNTVIFTDFSVKTVVEKPQQ